LLLQEGKIAKTGLVADVIRTYQHNFQAGENFTWKRKVSGNTTVYFDNIKLAVKGRQPLLELNIICTLKSVSRHNKAFLAIDINNSLGMSIMQAIPEIEPFIKFSDQDQEIQVEIILPPLIPDTYSLTVWLGPHNTETYDMVSNAVFFEVNESPTKGRTFPHTYDHGCIVPPSSITVRHSSNQMNLEK
jgi:lipopolysaccharide transport system ATP-binding protein